MIVADRKQTVTEMAELLPHMQQNVRIIRKLFSPFSFLFCQNFSSRRENKMSRQEYFIFTTHLSGENKVIHHADVHVIIFW